MRIALEKINTSIQPTTANASIKPEQINVVVGQVVTGDASKTWAEATETWDEATYTWGDTGGFPLPRVVIKQENINFNVKNA